MDYFSRVSAERRSKTVAEETIISWNAANWITILIMVALGFAILGFLTKVIQQKRAGKPVQ